MGCTVTVTVNDAYVFAPPGRRVPAFQPDQEGWNYGDEDFAPLTEVYVSEGSLDLLDLLFEV